MNIPLDRFVHWLADLHLLSSLLLLAGLMIVRRLKQPALRMAVARSIVVGLATLSLVVAAPGWPRGGLPQWTGDDVAPISNSAIPTIEHETSAMSRPTVERPPVASPPVIDPITPPTALPVSKPMVAFPDWRSIVLSAYAIGVTLNLTWLALGAFQAARLRRSVRIADSRVPVLLARVGGSARDRTRVCLSERIGQPVAIGVVRPMVVLPERFAKNESDEGLEAALAHELAHIQNGDLRWLAVLRLLTVVFFAQPLFWLLRRTIRADQEALADAAASTLHGDERLAYAETLVGWARSANGVRPGALASAALALWERPSLLRRRVSVLLDPDIHIEPTLSRRWRLTATCLGLIVALALSLFTVRPIAATTQIMKAQPMEKNTPVGARSKGDEMSERFEYAGRVLDPDGKPVAGAKLHLACFEYQRKGPPPVRATSDDQGRFHFVVTKQDFPDTDDDEPWKGASVIASVEGFGLAWASPSGSEDKPVDPLKLTLRLVRDDLPISGRIVDLQGHPVPGVSIESNQILESEGGDLSTWIADSRTCKGGSYEIEGKYLTHHLRSRGPVLAIAIMTDADGRFSIRGVGRERLIRLRMSGPTIQTKEISVFTRTSDPFAVTHARGNTDWGVSLYYGAQFTHAAAPTKPVVGVVKDKDTGKPLAGVRIECDKTAEYPVMGSFGIETTTDQNGRYRLIGLPKGRGNHVAVLPGKALPYLRAGLEIPDSPGLEPVALDISLKRGIVIEGRVTEQVTGKPVKAYVDYNAYQDNPNLSMAPGFADARTYARCITKPDGSFRIVGLPGRGLLSAMEIAGGGKYLSGVGLPEGLNQDEPLPFVPNGMQMQFNAFAQLELPKGATTVRQDLALQEGVTRTVRVIGPDGKPLAGAQIKFLPNIANFSQPQSKAEFEVQALRPKEIRVVEACHDGLKLAGLAEIHADEKEVAVLKLQPWGTVIGTLVDQDGEPRANIDLNLRKRWDKLIATDSKGHFRLEGFVPNRPTEIVVLPQPYFVSGNLGKPITLAPGEVRDLGKVREKKYGG